MVWLQGGPGASSLFGMLVENGPFSVNPADLSTVPNPHSWHTAAHMLYIDNPAGTGFSTGRLAHNGSTIAEDMHSALSHFYRLHPAYAASELFLFGESFAGHMIPQIADLIVSAGELPLAGIGMGDGWTSPLAQNGAWGDFTAAAGLLGPAQQAEVGTMYEKCAALIEKGEYIPSLQYCYQSLLTFVSNFTGEVNPYDIRMRDQFHDFSQVRSSVRVRDRATDRLAGRPALLPPGPLCCRLGRFAAAS